MARRKTTGAATGGAEIAPRALGHRSLVTKRDLGAHRRRLEAEPRGQRAELEESTEANLAAARQRVRLR
jgi:hypothetical protein